MSLSRGSARRRPWWAGAWPRWPLFALLLISCEPQAEEVGSSLEFIRYRFPYHQVEIFRQDVASGVSLWRLTPKQMRPCLQVPLIGVDAEGKVVEGPELFRRFPSGAPAVQAQRAVRVLLKRSNVAVAAPENYPERKDGVGVEAPRIKAGKLIFWVPHCRDEKPVRVKLDLHGLEFRQERLESVRRDAAWGRAPLEMARKAFGSLRYQERLDAVQRLRGCQELGSHLLLVQAAQKDVSVAVRVAAIKALSSCFEKDSFFTITHLLEKDFAEDVRLAAVAALAAAGDPLVVGFLERAAARDKSAKVRRAAQRALVQQGVEIADPKAKLDALLGTLGAENSKGAGGAAKRSPAPAVESREKAR